MRYLAIAAAVMVILAGVIFSTAGKKMMQAGDGAVTEAVLPQPGSAGAVLYKQYCGQCHGLPALDSHTPEESSLRMAGWPPPAAGLRLTVMSVLLMPQLSCW